MPAPSPLTVERADLIVLLAKRGGVVAELVDRDDDAWLKPGEAAARFGISTRALSDYIARDESLIAATRIYRRFPESTGVLRILHSAVLAHLRRKTA